MNFHENLFGRNHCVFLKKIEGLHGKPDLYGPFWVSVTLCFSTAICGNLANFIQNQGNPEYKYTPEFERVTSAASAIFGYAFIFPFFISCKFITYIYNRK